MKEKKYSPLLFVILLGIACTLWMTIYSRLAVGWDHEAHLRVAKWLFVHEIDWQEVISPENMQHTFSYPLTHILIKIVRLISAFDYEICLAIVLTVANVLSVYLYRKIISRQLDIDNSYFVDFVSVGLMLFMCARCWLNDNVIYYLQGGPNPIHNPTIVVCRPFGLLAFYFFCETMRAENKKEQNKNIIIYALALIISVLGKPSFAFILIPACGIYVVLDYIRNRELSLVLKMLGSMIPVGLVLIGQFIWIKKQAEILDVTFIHFGTFYSYSVWKVLAITIVNIPVVVIMFSWKKVKENIWLKVSLLIFIVAWAQQFFLTNGGSNDFMWGFNLAIGLVTANFLAESKIEKQDSVIIKCRKILAFIVFVYQIYVGLTYIKTGYIANSYRL